jgi:hypothetical protein
MLGIILVIFLWLKNWRSYCSLKSKTSVNFDHKENCGDGTYHTSNKRKDRWYLLHLPRISNWISRLSEVYSRITAIWNCLIRMIYWKRFYKSSLISNPILEGPNAVVSIDSIVSKINKGLRSYHTPKYHIVLIFQIIWFIIFTTWVDDRVAVIKSKVKEVIKLDKQLINLILRSARSTRISIITASRNSYSITWVYTWCIFPIKLDGET